MRGTSKQITSGSGTSEKMLVSQRLALKDCDQMLAKSVTEGNNAIHSNSLAIALLAVVKVSKMVCDPVIHILSKSTGPSRMIIERAYAGVDGEKTWRGCGWTRENPATPI